MYNREIEEVLLLKDTTKATGLSSAEAASRLEKNGKNSIAGAKKVPGWVLFVKQMKHIMMIVLFVAMFLSIITSLMNPEEAKWLAVGLIGGIILLNSAIGYFQESKAEKAVDALKKATRPFAKVLRDGEVVSIKTEDLVVGDVVLLEAGDIVPADMRLIEVASLLVEEAALTGESVPVEKSITTLSGENMPLGDQKNMAFMSGIITYGRGRGVVVATGMETQLGLIAGHLQKEKTPQTPLTKALDKTMKIITAIVGVVAALIFVTRAIAGDPIIDSMMLTIAIAVCAIPEALPICVSITMSMGVQRMSKKKAIVKNLPAVETLGSTEIICSDKTGTITLNKMTVQEVYTKVKEDHERLVRCMVLCNDTHAKYEGKVLSTIGDPTETALIHYAHDQGINKLALEEQFPRALELPFDSARKMMSTIVKDGKDYVMYTKGALERLIERCTKVLDNGKIRDLTEKDKKDIDEVAGGFAKKALRVLGYAFKITKEQDKLTPEDESDLVFIGLSGLIDPPRKEVTESVRICKEAGITTIMITGDHRDTAFAIAKAVGIAEDESQVVTGKELEEMSEKDLRERVLSIRVYARVNPEHKLRIVKAIKSLNKVVAMTGDGVNDAPSIKAADIGIGMGITGTEVTKGAADVILTDDNFATIVTAVEEGRRTYSNILKIIVYLVSLSLAEIILLTTLLAIFGLPFFNPILILWINVVTDTLPAIAMGSLPAEKDIMKQKPNPSGGSLFRGMTGVTIIVHAMFTTVLVFIVYLTAMFGFGYDDIVVITMSYVVLGVIETVHPFNLIHYKKSIVNSQPFQSKAVNLAVISTMIIVIGSIVLPLTALQDVLGITSLTWSQWLLAAGAGVMIVPMIEVYKVFKRQYCRRVEEREKPPLPPCPSCGHDYTVAA